MKINFKNKHKLLTLLTFVMLLFSMFKIWTAFSMSNLFSIENVTILAKSETLNEGSTNVTGNKILSDSIKFHKVGDYIKYSVKIKNNKDENYILKSITNDNKNEYISYSYENYKDIKLNSGETFDFVFTETYSTEVEDVMQRNQNFSVNFYFTLKNQKGDEHEEQIEHNTSEQDEHKLDNNPITGDNIILYSALLCISLIALILIFKKIDISKKINKSILTLLILLSAVYTAYLPQMAKSLEGESYKLVLENKAELKDKILVSYCVDETVNTKIIPYSTKVDLDDPYKDGYDFKGWRTDDGALFDLDVLIEDDINLTAIFEPKTYQINYNLNGGQAENPDSYTIEDEVYINDPSKIGYTFEGWTGTDLTELTKGLVIPQGSMENREYEAHWAPNHYTILFNSNTGSGNMESQTMVYDTPSYLLPNTFTKTDNKFTFWNTQPDGNGTTYNNEEFVENLAPEGEVTLYAQWVSASEWAMFKDGRWVNAKMKQLAGNANANYSTVDNKIVSIERSANPAPEGVTTTSVKSVYSPSPLDMWYDSTNKTIYYYSPAKYIYLNSDSRNLFGYFGALTNVDYSGFRTDEVTDMFGMFSQTKKLTNIDLSSFNTSKVTDMSSMFNQCNEANIIDVSKFDTRRVTKMNRMFTACEKVTDLDLSRFDTSNVTDMAKMFDYLPLVETIKVTHFNTQKVNTMEGMFRDLPKLKTLDLSSFDTRNVENMAEMFGCTDRVEASGLTSITIDNNKFSTSKVTSMKQMFYKCSNLKSFDFSGFNTSEVKNMSGMFAQCHSLTNINLSSFNTSKVTNTSSMFNNCNSVISIDVSSFDTSSVQNMNRMFSSCSSIQILDISNFNTISVTDMTKMFDNMTSLTTIYASSNFTTESVTSGSDMFKNDVNLVGGNGTACNGSQYTGYTYARIDGGESLPGYFTQRI